MTKIKEGYKETEIGVIPEDWDIEILNNLSVRIGDGLHGTPKYSDDGEYCFINGNNLKNGLIYITDDTKKVGNDEYEKNKVDLRNTSILISLNGTIGSLAFYRGEPIILSKSAGYVTLKDNQVTGYIYQVLKAKYVKDFILKELTGTTIRNLSLKTLRNIPIARGTLPEQQRISEILTTTDAHIEKLDKTILDYQLLKKGMMKKLLTEGIGHTEFKETEIGKIPKEWEVKSLGEICTVIAGQSPSSETYNENGIGLPFYQGRTEFGSINPITRKWCSEPIKIAEALDVLISVRAPVGDVNICEAKSCIGRGLAVIRESLASNYKFIYYLMQFSIDRINKVGQGSTFTAINTSDLKNFKVQVPLIEEQEIIADNLFEVDRIIEALKCDKNDLIQLNKSLMEKLLTGKIRVVPC